MSLSQEVLVLRQVAALRRAGLPHDQALRASAEGLPAGPLKQRVQAALAVLDAGGSAGRGLEGVLASAAPVEALDLAALSAEAELDAQAAVASTRRLLMLLLAGAPLLVCGAAWVGHYAAGVSGPELLESSPVVEMISVAARYAGAPLAALGAALGHRLGARFAPGRPQLEAAIALLRDTSTARLPWVDVCTRRYLALRLAAGTPERAAREVGEELVREARDRLDTFRMVAPLVAAVVLVPIAAVAAGPAVHSLLGLSSLAEM